jgi:hypothetical protein
MSGIDSVTDPPAIPDEPVTEKIVIPTAPGATATRVSVPFDPSSEPEDWPARGAAKGFRVNWLSAFLLVVLIAGGGIWGGAELQKHDGSSSSTSALASALASRFGASGRGSTTGRSGAASRFGGAGGGSGAAATGTVTEIKGSTLYITNASGNLVQVTLSPSTSVTRYAKTTAAALVPGDTVIVEGTTQKNGTVTASSVAATAQGVSSGFGGAFAGGG